MAIFRMRVIWVICFVAMHCAMPGAARALEIETAVDTKRKYLYLNLWGEIVSGDEKKFHDSILPYLADGYVLFAVATFSPGGNVQEAMGIGRRIRLLNARTIAPSRRGRVVNNNVVWDSRPSCWPYETGFESASAQPDKSHRPCTCASACFLIWANGVAREGNYVAVHRIYFRGDSFGKLGAVEARERYKAAERDYKSYVLEANVPATIVDRMFATGSEAIHVLTASELEIMKSTPYLEEHTLSRCGRSKGAPMSASNNWTYREDTVHMDCYRGILYELMQDGRRKYLGAMN